MLVTPVENSEPTNSGEARRKDFVGPLIAVRAASAFPVTLPLAFLVVVATSATKTRDQVRANRRLPPSVESRRIEHWLRGAAFRKIDLARNQVAEVLEG